MKKTMRVSTVMLLAGCLAFAACGDDDDDDRGIGDAIAECIDACEDNLDSCSADCEDDVCQIECADGFDDCRDLCG